MAKVIQMPIKPNGDGTYSAAVLSNGTFTQAYTNSALRELVEDFSAIILNSPRGGNMILTAVIEGDDASRPGPS